MNKILSTLKVSLPTGMDYWPTYSPVVCPAKLFFKPRLVNPADLQRIAVNTTQATLAITPVGKTPRLWPDGSVREVRADVLLNGNWRQGDSMSVVLLDAPAGKKIDDVVRPAVTTAAKGFKAADAARDVLSSTFKAKDPNPEFAVMWGGETVPFGATYLLSSTDFVTDYVTKGQLPGGRFVNLYTRFTVGIGLVEWWLHYGWADGHDPAPSKDLADVRVIGNNNMQIYVCDAQSKTLGTIGDQAYGSYITSPAGDWNDGQSFAVRGVAVVGDIGATPIVPPVVWQSDAAAHGAFGWIIDTLPTYDATRSADAWAKSQMSKLVYGDPCQGGYWVPTEAGQTGDHAGFGLLGPASAVFYGSSEAINLMRFSFYQEALRPIWWGGTNHEFNNIPNDVMVWDERPHPAGNMLGKSSVPNIYTNGLRTQSGLIWWGMDRQHGEDVNWITYLTLVCDPMAEDMARWRSKLWMAMLRTDTGNETIDSTDSGRGARLLGMLCRYYIARPSAEIADCIRKRISLYGRGVVGTGTSLTSSAKVAPQQVYGPSDQAGGLPLNHWRPWEDAIVAYVLALCYAAIGDPVALASAQALAANLVQHGYETKPDGSKRIYVALAFNDGVPLNEGQLKDPALAKTSEGTGYNLWSDSAAVVAWNSSIMLGEQKPDARPAMIETMRAAFAVFTGTRSASNPSIFNSPFAKYEDAGENSEWTCLEILPPPAWFSFSDAALN